MLTDALFSILGPICVAVPFVLAIVVLWIPRRLAMRGFESSIDMDGAILLKASNGSVEIRRRNIGIWMVIGVFGLVAVGTTIGLIFNIVDAIKGQSIADLNNPCLALGIILPMAGISFAAYQSLTWASYSFNVDTYTLIVTEKRELSAISFREIECVFLESQIDRRGGRRIAVGLTSGEKTTLGSVSGTGAGKRGQAIADAIASAVAKNVELQPSSRW